MLIRQGRAFTPSAILETRILESEEIVVEGAERPNGLRFGVTNVDGRRLVTECRGLAGLVRAARQACISLRSKKIYRLALLTIDNLLPCKKYFRA